MKKVIITLMAIGLFVLVGCSASGPEATESVEDIIIGTWHRTSGGPRYIGFREDGTSHNSTVLEAVIEDRGEIQWQYRFEGTQLILEETRGPCKDENPIGSYEVHLLENGNLQFVVIEDECPGRAAAISARPEDGITREWELVP